MTHPKPIHMGRKQSAVRIQTGDHYHPGLTSELENAVLREKGVICSIKIVDETAKITAHDYPDYVMARSVVSKRTGLEVIRG